MLTASPEGMRTLAKRLLLPFLIVLFLAIIAVLASRYASLDWFVRNDRWLRSVIRANPVTSSFIAFAIYLIVSLVPGTTGKSIVLGWLFGLLVGVIIVNTALVAASLVTFLLCRYYLKAEVQSRFGFYLRPIQRRMRSDGTLYLLTLRLAHAPFSFMNYAAGVGTDVSFHTFWWTTQLGLLPGNIVFVYAGSRLPTIEEAIVRGPLGLLDGPMMLAPWLTTFPSVSTARGFLVSVAAGLLIVVAAFLGDINMSAIKRDVGVKDGSSILPGMGGVIDRVDSLTFTAPAFYYFLIVVL